MVTATIVGLGHIQFRSNLDRHFEGEYCSLPQGRSNLLGRYRYYMSHKLGVSNIWGKQTDKARAMLVQSLRVPGG